MLTQQSHFLILIGKSWKIIQKIFKNFSFPGNEPDRITGKLIHQNFMSTYSVFVKYRVMSQAVLLENLPTSGCVSQ